MRYNLGRGKDWRKVDDLWSAENFLEGLVHALGPGSETNDTAAYTSWTRELIEWYDEYVYLDIRFIT